MKVPVCVGSNPNEAGTAFLNQIYQQLSIKSHDRFNGDSGIEAQLVKLFHCFGSILNGRSQTHVVHIVPIRFNCGNDSRFLESLILSKSQQVTGIFALKEDISFRELLDVVENPDDPFVLNIDGPEITAGTNENFVW